MEKEKDVFSGMTNTKKIGGKHISGVLVAARARSRSIDRPEVLKE